ncbi:hypothetical protein BA6E_11049 [Bacteroidales bacterium 6E]|nr:hypothetical protein BA6E_11049 [Bacteroidales bacterium 6E]
MGGKAKTFCSPKDINSVIKLASHANFILLIRGFCIDWRQSRQSIQK